MKIRIKLYGVLRIDRFKDEVFEYPDGTDFARIADEFNFCKNILGIILVNGQHATFETTIKDGDTLSLLPMISGG